MSTIPTKEEMKKTLEQRHGKKLQNRFSEAVVAVCGLGGLGSNIAIALARAGIGKLILIDFDKVEISNLHRQQYFISQIGLEKSKALAATLREIMPYTKVDAHTERITEENIEELLGDADIVCEAFDKAEEKAMLVNEILQRMPEKFLIASSGMAGMHSANTVKTKKITNHFYVCGDNVSDVSDDIGLVSSRVMVCAAHQAHMVLRILARQYDA